MAPTLDPGCISLTLCRPLCVLETKEPEETVSASAVLYLYKKKRKKCLLSDLGVLCLYLNGHGDKDTFNSLGRKKKANGKCLNIVWRRLSSGLALINS